MIAKNIIDIGNSKGLILPIEFLKQNNIKKGDSVKLSYNWNKSKIIITKS